MDTHMPSINITYAVPKEADKSTLERMDLLLAEDEKDGVYAYSMYYRGSIQSKFLGFDMFVPLCRVLRNRIERYDEISVKK